MTKNLNVSSRSTRSHSLKDPDVHIAIGSYFAVSVPLVGGADVFFVFVEGDDVGGDAFGLGEAFGSRLGRVVRGPSERVAGLRKSKSRLGISFGRRLTGCIIPLMAVTTVRIALPMGVAMLGD